MTTQDIISFASLFLLLVSVITNYWLQRDSRNIRDLERKNEKYRNKLVAALKAIKGYQLIECDYAEKEGLEVQTYRARIREGIKQYFDTKFLSPSNIDALLADLEND